MASEEDLPDPDEDLVLFPEEQQQQQYHPDVSKPKASKSAIPEEPEYVLGTIIVRVVAARGLENPIPREGFFRNNSSGSATNPYASIKFGKTTQRTSEVYSTLDPIWPRGEVFFMDVSLPESQVKHSLPEDGSPESSSSSSSLEDPFYNYQQPDNTTLTVALFHKEMVQQPFASPTKDQQQPMFGDSDDTFLGMASIDLTALVTGKVAEVDEWLGLNGTFRNSKASVRVVCEYEVSDVPPKAGDLCRFTKFCHPRDLYPLEASRLYKVDSVDGNIVLLSYESPEGWHLSFQAHTKMLICEERQASPMWAQEELQSLGERLSASPLVVSVTEAVERVSDDGLVGIAESIVKGSAFVFDRWFKGGVDTVIRDLQDVTNLDGRHNIHHGLDALESPTSSMVAAVASPASGDDDDDDKESYHEQEGEALPNMPPCPITGFPMVDPVVAADGHTYERTAIARWLKTSDKSPMTGSILVHKELVPNYGLMSSIQEAAMLFAPKDNANDGDGDDDDRKPPPITYV